MYPVESVSSLFYLPDRSDRTLIPILTPYHRYLYLGVLCRDDPRLGLDHLSPLILGSLISDRFPALGIGLGRHGVWTRTHVDQASLNTDRVLDDVDLDPSSMIGLGLSSSTSKFTVYQVK